MIYTLGYDKIQQLWDIDRKIVREIFGRKVKPIGFIYPPVSKFLMSEVNLTMSSFL